MKYNKIIIYKHEIETQYNHQSNNCQKELKIYLTKVWIQMKKKKIKYKDLFKINKNQINNHNIKLEIQL